MLTPRQRDLLTFIADYQRGHGGVSPSFDEMAAEIGVRSKGAIFRLLDALELQRRIRRPYQRARAIEVLGDPDLTCRPGSRPRQAIAYCIDPDDTASREAFYQRLRALPKPLPYQPVEAA